MNKSILAAAAVIAACAMLAGCGGNQGGSSAEAAMIAEVSMRELVEVADPQGAAEAIYEMLEDRRVEALDAEELLEVLGVDPEETGDFVAYQSDANAGLCDLAILQVEEDSRDELREALLVYKDRRMEEFKNFDILDSYAIAQNAVVYEQGDYLIMLMLPDNEAAQAVVDEYIPR